MAVTRINEFHAREGRGDELFERLVNDVRPKILRAPGNVSCRVLQSAEDPDRVVVLEEWGSIEAHQAAVRNIPPDAFKSMMALLDGSPKGEYFRD